jgi:hypothetical protein
LGIDPEEMMLMPSQDTLEPIQEADPHPLATALVVGGIALVGAVVFAGSIAAWLILPTPA